jgi:hypothetical protein
MAELICYLLKGDDMKKVIAALFIMACSVNMAWSQSLSENGVHRFTIGAFGGLNMPKLTGGGGNPLSENWSSREGAAFGLTFTWNTGPHFAWRADVLYSSEGGQRDGMQAIDGSSYNPQVPAGTYFYAKFKNESILNYLEVPVMGKYSFFLSKSSKFYVDLGPYIGFKLKARQRTKGSSIIYADPAGNQPVSVNPQTGEIISVSMDSDTNIKNQIRTMNLGLTGGIGLTQKLGFGELFFDLRGAYGLTNIQKYPETDGNNHMGNLLLSLGYSVPL